MTNKLNISLKSISILIKYFFISMFFATIILSLIYFLDLTEKESQFTRLQEKIKIFEELNTQRMQTFPEFKEVLNKYWFDVDENDWIPLINKETNKLNCSVNKNQFEYTDSTIKVTIPYVVSWNNLCEIFSLKKEPLDLKSFILDSYIYIIIISCFFILLLKLTDPFVFIDKDEIKEKLKSTDSDYIEKYLIKFRDYFSQYHLKEEDPHFQKRLKEFYLINLLYLRLYRRFPVIKKVYTEIIKSLNLSYSDLSNDFYIQLKLLEWQNYWLKHNFFYYLWNKFFQLSSKYITSFVQLFLFILFSAYVSTKIMIIIFWTWQSSSDNEFLNYFDEVFSVMSNLWWHMNYVTNSELIFHLWIQVIGVVLFWLLISILVDKIKK